MHSQKKWRTIGSIVCTVLSLGGCSDLTPTVAVPPHGSQPINWASRIREAEAVVTAAPSVDLYVVTTQHSDSVGAEGDWRALLQRADFRTVGKLWPYANAFIAEMPRGQASILQALTTWVSAVEQTQGETLQQLQSTQSPAAPWELARITHVPWPTTPASFEPATRGSGGRIFVLDTGADVNHPEIAGRVQVIWSADRTNRTTDNCTAPAKHAYHGTKVTSKIVGRTLGVAPDATVAVLGVFNCQPSSAQPRQMRYAMLSALMHLRSLNLRNAVINVSGDVWIDPLDPVYVVGRAWLQRWLSTSGNQLVVAGENSTNMVPGKPACSWFLRSIPESIVVTSTDAADVAQHEIACQDIAAPGVDVQVAVGPNQTVIESGASFAAPLVAGTLAQYRAKDPGRSAAEYEQALYANAIPDRVTLYSTSPNRLLFAGASKHARVLSSTVWSRPGTSSLALPLLPFSSAPVVHRLLAAWGYVWPDSDSARPSSSLTIDGVAPSTVLIVHRDAGTWAAIGDASYGFIGEWSPTLPATGGAFQVAGWNQPTATPNDEGARGVSVIVVYSLPNELIQAPLTDVVVDPFHVAIRQNGSAQRTLTVPTGSTIYGPTPVGASVSKLWTIVGDGEAGYNSRFSWWGGTNFGVSEPQFQGGAGKYWDALYLPTETAAYLLPGERFLETYIDSRGDWLFWTGLIWEVSVH